MGYCRTMKAEKKDAIEYLKKNLKKGDTLFTIVTKVAPSGMSRRIKVLDIKDGNPSYWSYYVSKALGYKLKDDGSLLVQGCGMDMGFHLIYTLSSKLYEDGYAIKQSWV